MARGEQGAVADSSRLARSVGVCQLRETHRFISRVDPASGGARRRWLLGRVALSGELRMLASPTTLPPSSRASSPAHPGGGGVDMYTAPDSPACPPDAECASGRLADATMAPAAVSGALIAVATVAGWAIDDADVSVRPAHPWVARPCMKNNPQSTAPTAIRRAVACTESALPLTVSPVAVPVAWCGPRYSRKPVIRELAGIGNADARQLDVVGVEGVPYPALFRKGANFTAAMSLEIGSTNLVIEMGVILASLMGWQFTAARDRPPQSSEGDHMVHTAIRTTERSRCRGCRRQLRGPCRPVSSCLLA